MLTLHYITDSRSHRLVWMLEELGVDYRVQVHPRGSDQLAPASIKALHPVGKAPLLEESDGQIFAESGHIAEHLAERYGPHLIPEGEQARLDYRYWMHFAEGSLAPPLVATFLFGVVEQRTPRLLRPLVLAAPRLLEKAYYNTTIAALLGFVDEHLAGRDFFVGDALSTVDIMMSFPLEAASARLEGYSNIQRWVGQIQARPAYKKALDAAGVPYRLGG